MRRAFQRSTWPLWGVVCFLLVGVIAYGGVPMVEVGGVTILPAIRVNGTSTVTNTTASGTYTTSSSTQPQFYCSSTTASCQHDSDIASTGSVDVGHIFKTTVSLSSNDRIVQFNSASGAQAYVNTNGNATFGSVTITGNNGTPVPIAGVSSAVGTVINGFHSSGTEASIPTSIRLQTAADWTTAGKYLVDIGDNASTSFSRKVGIDINGFYLQATQSVTVASNGGGTAATDTLTPTGSEILYTCNDTDGCDVTLSETGAQDGEVIRIVNMSANAVNFADTSGVTELAGASALGQYDSISMIYATDRWVQLGGSNN